MTCFELKEQKKHKGNVQNTASRMMVILASIFFVALAVVSPASASIDTDLNNFTTIIGNSTYGLTGLLVNMMGVFMQPPLVYFVVIGIFVLLIGIVAGLVMRRGRRGRR